MKRAENYLEYKGYHTRIEFDSEDMILHGKIEGINDLVTFESSDATKIVEEFHSAVDDYLVFCEEVGKDPEKEYKGVFNVRVTPELHRALATVAYRSSETLNAVVETALEMFVNSISVPIEEIKYVVESYSPVLNNRFSVTELNSNCVYRSTKEAS